MNHHKIAGFTLIEMMIVTSIISVLAAAAIPAYQTFTTRAKMAELIVGLSSCRTTISEVYVSGNLPGPNEWGCESTTTANRYIHSITTDGDGVVTAVAGGFNNPDIDGLQVQLVPYKSSGTRLTAADAGERVSQWVCGPGTPGVPVGYLPAPCRGQVSSSG